jgi:hypothetical protein
MRHALTFELALSFDQRDLRWRPRWNLHPWCPAAAHLYVSLLGLTLTLAWDTGRCACDPGRAR